MGHLDDIDHTTAFCRKALKVTKEALVLACGNRTNTLYLISGASDVQENTGLQQSGLGHVNKMGKRKGVRLGPETTVRSRGVRAWDIASSVTGMSTPKVMLAELPRRLDLHSGHPP